MALCSYTIEYLSESSKVLQYDIATVVLHYMTPFVEVWMYNYYLKRPIFFFICRETGLDDEFVKMSELVCLNDTILNVQPEYEPKCIAILSRIPHDKLVHQFI